MDPDEELFTGRRAEVGPKGRKKVAAAIYESGRGPCPSSGQATAAGHLHISLTPLGLSGLHNPFLPSQHRVAHTYKVEVAQYHVKTLPCYLHKQYKEGQKSMLFVVFGSVSGRGALHRLVYIYIVLVCLNASSSQEA